MKTTILIIDDDPIDITPLRMMLEGWGMEVLTAASGEEGLKLLTDREVDVVLSDVRMPGMDGERVVEEIGRTDPLLPVVLVTAHASVKSAVQAMKVGAYDYVSKPVHPDELRLTIERALEQGRLRRENRFLRDGRASCDRYGERLIGSSPAMQTLFGILDRVARTDSTVLITGETGTGKELVAEALHARSNRSDKPFIAFNCAALNPNLVESELFGHEKGAFTGAVAARSGLFEEADHGTILLDEISETSVEFQAKLLRVLQEGEIQRLGQGKVKAVDVRVLASSNRDLKKLVEEKTFREDLFYRLQVIPVRVPPLRERAGDISLLARHFVHHYAEQYGLSRMEISKEGLAALEGRSWPGNVRELQHAVERAVVLADGCVLEASDFRFEEQEVSPDDDLNLSNYTDRSTREHVLRVLERTGWHKQRAADLLGITRVTLYRMLKRFQIEGPDA